MCRLSLRLALFCPWRSYRWDAAKVKEVLARKREAGALPVNLAREKSRLRELLAAAQERGDEAEMAMCVQGAWGAVPLVCSMPPQLLAAAWRHR